MDESSPLPVAGQSAFLDDPMRAPSPSHFQTSDFGTLNRQPAPAEQATAHPQPQPTSGDASSNGQPEQPSLAPHSERRRASYSLSQYYIVFSVTGIERSNPKNPIVRFDAKVSPSSCVRWGAVVLTCVDQPASISCSSRPRYSTRTSRAREASGSSHLCKP